MKIEFLVGGLELVGFGVTEKGKKVEVSDVLGAQLVSEGIAKPIKASKIKEETKVSEGDK
jgi:hypothetical protein|tara:strand:+ start:509 stop:688 length:180 start_codon:yes stop_codon:yes gene_type:complete